MKEVKFEEVVSQLNAKPEEISNEIRSTAAVESDEVATEENAEGITRKQRKELLSDSQEKQLRTLFLGNLPITCATDKAMIKTLKARFSPYGPVESIRFRSIPFAEPQARRVAFIKKNFRKDGFGGTCNGYVVMKSRDGALAALKENATIFAERHLRVDMAAEGEEGSTKTNTKKSIFIGNLPMELEEEPVWQLFGKCGSVSNVRLIRDRVTNMGKGIGYVTFTSKDSVDLALKLAGTNLGDRPVRVSPCAKIGMAEKKKVRANNLAEKRQKKAAALIKSNPVVASSKLLGAAKTEITIPSPDHNVDNVPKKVSKKEAKLQNELQTKFGQLFHKKFPFAQAISEIDSKPSEKSEKSGKVERFGKSEKSSGKVEKSEKSEKSEKYSGKLDKKSKSKSKSLKSSSKSDKPSKFVKEAKVFKSKSEASTKIFEKKTDAFKPTKIVIPTSRNPKSSFNDYKNNKKSQ